MPSVREIIAYAGALLIPLLALAALLYAVHELRVQLWERKQRQITRARLYELFGREQRGS